MNLILSFGYKVMELEYDKLISVIESFPKGEVNGFELHVHERISNEYLLKFVKYITDNGYTLRVHSPSFDNIDSYLEVFKFFDEEFYNIYGKKMNVVLHPIHDEDINKSIEKTCQYVEKIYEVIDKDRITISIENLNDRFGLRRMKKEEIEKILVRFDDLKFTYDIGHEIIENRLNPDLSDILKQRINNIHAHIYEGEQDHHPLIDFNDERSLKILDALHRLDFNEYVVTEYSVQYMKSEILEDKIKEYINYSIMLKEKLKEA